MHASECWLCLGHVGVEGAHHPCDQLFSSAHEFEGGLRASGGHGALILHLEGDENTRVRVSGGRAGEGRIDRAKLAVGSQRRQHASRHFSREGSSGRR